jgi:hypothetical protein
MIAEQREFLHSHFHETRLDREDIIFREWIIDKDDPEKTLLNLRSFVQFTKEISYNDLQVHVCRMIVVLFLILLIFSVGFFRTAWMGCL